MLKSYVNLQLDICQLPQFCILLPCLNQTVICHVFSQLHDCKYFQSPPIMTEMDEPIKKTSVITTNSSPPPSSITPRDHISPQYTSTPRQKESTSKPDGSTAAIHRNDVESKSPRRRARRSLTSDQQQDLTLPSATLPRNSGRSASCKCTVSI